MYRIVAGVHMLILAINTAAIVVLPLTEPVWVWLPICTYLVRASFGHTCPLTTLENRLRASSGLPQIPGFVEYYIWGKR